MVNGGGGGGGRDEKLGKLSMVGRRRQGCITLGMCSLCSKTRNDRISTDYTGSELMERAC